MTNSLTRLSTFGLSSSAWKVHRLQGLCYARRRCSLARECTVRMLNFLVAQVGSGGFVRGMVSETFHSKVRSYQQSSFRTFVEEESLSLDHIFNCDETGLNYRLLPQKNLVAAFEKCADGRKKAMDRVTINACSNASGSFKLPLQLTGKAQRPRCFRGIRMELLPVQYSGQKNAWMTTSFS